MLRYCSNRSHSQFTLTIILRFRKTQKLANALQMGSCCITPDIPDRDVKWNNTQSLSLINADVNLTTLINSRVGETWRQVAFSGTFFLLFQTALIFVNYQPTYPVS